MPLKDNGHPKSELISPKTITAKSQALKQSEERLYPPNKEMDRHHESEQRDPRALISLITITVQNPKPNEKTMPEWIKLTTF